ncbi:MAG: TerC family protein [Candidatus Eisenbacteria bacterium]|nr:TerC family protein [Candidatus Eisenbacteria bacterium]
METVGSPALWTGFLALVLLLLAVDLGIFHRKAHAVSVKEAAIWSAVWVGLAVLANLAIALRFGPDKGLEFATGYLIEKALAVDNIFVFVVIFSSFGIPALYQHRILFWGILGALVLRAAFILAGGYFLHRFHWMIYLFGGLLLATGIRLFLQRKEEPHPENHVAVRAFRRLMPVTSVTEGGRFTVVRDGKRWATPLLLALVAVEVSDLILAIDSIPAIFAVTKDPFLVFTSNIFAILGLRSLYFLLAGIIDRFHCLKPALSFVLVFVGAKMLLTGIVKIPIGLSLAVIGATIGGAIALSLARRPRASGEQASGRGARSPGSPHIEG